MYFISRLFLNEFILFIYLSYPSTLDSRPRALGCGQFTGTISYSIWFWMLLPRDAPKAGASISPLLCALRLPNRIPVSMQPTHGIPTLPRPVCQQNRATDEAVNSKLTHCLTLTSLALRKSRAAWLSSSRLSSAGRSPRRPFLSLLWQVPGLAGDCPSVTTLRSSQSGRGTCANSGSDAECAWGVSVNIGGGFISLCCYNKITATRLQKKNIYFISSRGWGVQDPGSSRSSVWRGLSFWFADSCLLAGLTR